ncbi:proline--tRNA ligase [Trueperella sp. LYQ143]|uniref:proline--tRNA ligase n=1 Tax=Trueperella sp. LYQ143 TaxID=3391059 RepID=UPI003983406C
MSKSFIKTLREDPADAEVESHKLLVRAGYIRRTAPGVYTWLPLGLRVLRKIEAVIREEMDKAGAQELLFSALQPREPYEKTGRWDEYGPNLFRLQDRRENDYLLAPTHEEMFTLATKDMCSSYKDLPLVIYQFQTKFRDEARPRAGLLRTREFVMKDAYSFDVNTESLAASYQLMRDTYERAFTRLGLPYVICRAVAGAMGGSHSEEFLMPCAIGEDSYVVSDGGYAANVEAVTTPDLGDVDFSSIGDPVDIDSPDAKSIERLVEVVNAAYPRADRLWEAADMLKNVVVVATYPDGERELIVIGIPGDREADLKRIEAQLAPAEVEMATAEDLAAHPELVAGYIGPRHIGPNSPKRTYDDNGVAHGSVRYFVDPHIRRGSAWITGADRPEWHTANIVFGRDFEVDGTIEAVEVRDGDPAPDGSGPLRMERGIEIGHIFQLGTKYADALGLTVLDENGKTRVVTMGSYGIGVSRLVAALAELNHDERGLAWPALIAPADVHIIATGKDEQIFHTAQSIAEELDSQGISVIYDDRPRMSAGVKFTDYELIGVPRAIVVGRGLADGQVELRDRRAGENISVPVDEIVSRVVEDVRSVR